MNNFYLTEKAVGVVTSCTTLEQLKCARRYINLLDGVIVDQSYVEIFSLYIKKLMALKKTIVAIAD